MAGRIRDTDIALVRERSPITEVVGAYVQLRPAGAGRLKGLCPFHEEKTPSFSINPSAGLYHCFGCGVGGDVIRFLRDIENLTFVEAVERLAARAGVELTYEGGRGVARAEVSRRQRLIDAHAEAARFYAGCLDSEEALPARRFLQERGFDRAAAQRFSVGFAPSGWDVLTRHLLNLRFPADDLVAGGLAKHSSRGTLIDRFRRRVLWPIRELGGAVVGFGARRLFDDDQGPKYLNTPETPIFHKGSLLYGADLARRDIGARYQAVVVEGYTDVMACHLAGVSTAVATCGTSFGPEHIGVLRRLLLDQDEFRSEVIFLFDGDEAGRAAALRAFKEDQRFVAQTFVAVERSGVDPCDLRRMSGDAALRELVARRVPLVEFVLRSVLAGFDLETAEGRAGALHEAAPMIARIRDRALRPEYARRLAGWLGHPDPELVMTRVAELAGERPRATGKSPGRPAGRGGTAADEAALAVEREAVKAAVQRPVLAGPAFDALDPAVFTSPQYRAVSGIIFAAGGAAGAGDNAAWVGALSEQAPNDAARGVLTALAVEPLCYDGDDVEGYVAQVLDRLRELDVTRRTVELKSRLQRMNPIEQADQYNKLLAELVTLEQQRRALRERGLGG
ncbi:MAG: DNA primase [Frankiaceae bacterium]